MTNLQTYYHFRIDFQNVDHYAIFGLQSLSENALLCDIDIVHILTWCKIWFVANWEFQIKGSFCPLYLRGNCSTI